MQEATQSSIANSLRLSVRVGVTGHRAWTGDSDEIAQRVGAVLRAIAEVASAVSRDPSAGYASAPPVLRVISPIAEGADRLVAREGIARGYELQCPLPFFREEYEKDFSTDASRAEFQQLLSHANAVFELDCDRAEGSHPYQTVGRIMLAQCDLLIAIWDGLPPKGTGGTSQMVAEAAEQEIPIIWINPATPGVIQLRLCVGDVRDTVIEHDQWQPRLAAAMNRLLRVPLEQEHGHEGMTSCTPHGEFQKCLVRDWPSTSILGRIWRGFVTVASFPPRRGGRRSTPPPSSLPDPFANEHARADATSSYFAGLYRGSFVTNYILGTFAVLLALLVVVAPHGHHIWPWFELATIGIIVLVIRAANAWCWHQKSIDCRYYAEQLRLMRYLWPLARVTPASRPPAHHSFGDPRVTCMNWRFRAVLRNIGMASARVTPEYRAACLALVRDRWIGGSEGQIAYHHSTALRLSRMDHRLHLLARWLFRLTAAACAAHLLWEQKPVSEWLTLLTGFLPAAAASAHGISSQGEFRRLAERSKAMAIDLVHARRALQRLSWAPNGFTATDLYRTVSTAAAAMIDEVTDWRILYRKPPIDPA